MQFAVTKLEQFFYYLKHKRSETMMGILFLAFLATVLALFLDFVSVYSKNKECLFYTSSHFGGPFFGLVFHSFAFWAAIKTANIFGIFFVHAFVVESNKHE